ncbi:MAG TPA: hypothetical protein VGP47_04600 [Parachlamydiaceae bacterium]|nr:hypothetical protein [Parachlamydiaceae bacterium]
MKKLFLSLILTSMGIAAHLSAVNISAENAHKIAEKIWKNECAGTVQGLTCWNKGENFASLGIGHFIWYPPGKKEGFQESFPELLCFLEKQGFPLPPFLKNNDCCLWNTRDDFYAAIDSPEMNILRKFLLDTKDLQAIFIAKRLEKTLPGMVKNLSNPDKEHVTKTFLSLENNSQGLYALIDYLNFKGSGSTPSESYSGKGWGLLQVLQGTKASDNVITAFVASAKRVLIQRVDNSPPERNEQRWLKGWLNRVDTYLE